MRLQKENGLEQTATLDAHTIVTMFGNIGPSQGSSMPPMPIRALVNDEFRNQASSARTVRATTPHKIAAALFAAAYAARNGCAVREVWHPCAAVTAWVALTGHRSVAVSTSSGLEIFRVIGCMTLRWSKADSNCWSHLQRGPLCNALGVQKRKYSHASAAPMLAFTQGADAALLR